MSDTAGPFDNKLQHLTTLYCVISADRNCVNNQVMTHSSARVLLLGVDHVLRIKLIYRNGRTKHLLFSLK